MAAPWLKWIVNAPAVKAQLVADLKLRETYEVPRSAVVASARARVATRPGEASSSLSYIDGGAFLKLYDLQFGRLGALQRAGLTKRIGYINEDMDICDVGWCAYMLWPNGSSNPVHQVGQNERDDDTEKRPTGRFMENVNRQYQGHVKDEG